MLSLAPKPPTADQLYLGYRPDEAARLPWARWFRSQMAPLPANVNEALAIGAVSHELLPGPEQAALLQEPGYQSLETGYARTPDRGGHVAVLNTFPGSTPAMWEWWFAWHGSETSRYKLWHPRAHVHVGWRDGRGDLGHYLGRVSEVVEYVGSERLKVAIAFVPPASFGFDEARLRAGGEVIICAEVFIRLAGVTVRSGLMAHHLRSTAGGCEMRSRFWLGGRHVRLFGIGGRLGEGLGRLVGRLQPLQEHQLRELLVHDAQEMNHLAAILPELYREFGPDRSSQSGPTS